MAQVSKEALARLAGKYLTFELGGEIYGLEILKVQEIIGMMNITRVPKMPDYVRGVVNLRGKVIPVVELRIKFGMEAKEDTERTVIIVVQVVKDSQQVIMGVIVDEVSEVLDIGASEIEPSPDLGSNVDSEFILAMGKMEDRVVMMLDVDEVLTGGDMEAVTEMAE